MLLTIAYTPIVLPLLFPEINIDTWQIAKSLILLMFIPLIIGLIIHAKLKHAAKYFLKITNPISYLCLFAIVLLMLIINFNKISAIFCLKNFFIGILFIIVSFFIGYYLGGSDKDSKILLGLGTGQRNVSAVLV